MPSETSKVRHLVIPYCIGFGCDIGFGGDKIIKENCLGIDLATPYGNTGGDKVDIPCDLGKESIPVKDSYFDYVYSSHLIEDFEDTERILIDFFRITKTNGNIILVFPDQAVYESICKKTGQLLNKNHFHKQMGLDYMKSCLKKVSNRLQISYDIVFSNNCVIDYNVVMVIKIHKPYLS